MANIDARVWQDKRIARRYLEGIRGAIPLAAEQVELMLRLIRARALPVRRILDLGCGDGFLAAAILEEWLQASADLVDFSETMLEAARSRFGDHAERVAIIHGDYGKPGWTRVLGERPAYDVIVSGFSIHHQPDTRKRSLYAELFAMLAPGGIFLNIEHVSSPTPWLKEQAEKYLVDSLFAYHNALEPRTREEVAREFVGRQDAAANILAPVALQCDWLREIGLEDVDCYLKIFELAVFGGRKPPT